MDFEHELERVAQQYRNEGYDVTLLPKGDHLPAFAAGFRVDLLATRRDENVLVRVLRTRSELQADPEVPRQADVTNQHAGWRYDVVILYHDDPVRRAGGGEPTVEQIQEMLDEAERVAPCAAYRAAFVLAWAALEAVLRRLARPAGLGGDSDTQPAVLMRELYVNGHLSHEDFVHLDQLRQLRAAIIHGLVPPSVDAEKVQTILNIAKRLLAESEQVQAVAS
jgi:hypothetical protein